jgi:hypothetical protein
MHRIRFTKDYGSHKKGDIVELRSAEAKQAIKAKVASVQTDLSAESYQTKESSGGNSQNLRTNKSRRR